MGDRELLEMAAKAVGINLDRDSQNPRYRQVTEILPEWVYWNPLTDDGDALRLAVKLGMRVYGYPGQGDDFTVAATDSARAKQYSVREDHGADPCAATRRAIVRAAAEIGKAMS